MPSTVERVAVVGFILRLRRQVFSLLYISLSSDVTTDERDLIADGIRVTGPSEKSCFANALRMWEFDDRFSYVERFALVVDPDVGGIEDAWCMLDGELLVDPTTASFHYFHGVVIDDSEILQKYAEEYPYEGILGNHKNRYAYLRKQ